MKQVFTTLLGIITIIASFTLLAALTETSHRTGYSSISQVAVVISGSVAAISGWVTYQLNK